MSATYRPRLVNGRFGDPALFVEMTHERKAVLFDMGDLSALSARDLLRVRTVGVSHMHIDHLIGFDLLLRVHVGRDAVIDMIGPEGFADCIGHKLRGYSWDLVGRYETDLVFQVAELISPERLHCWRFRLSRRFAPEPVGERPAPGGRVHDDGRRTITARILEHHGPCVAFALEERQRVNVWRNRVEEAGLPVGPWLKPLKDAVRDGARDDAPIALPDGSSALLGSLRDLVSSERGMKIGYATDLRDTPSNRAALEELCAGADILFIEASFATEDALKADERAHLTTRAAGEIARACAARRIEPFHFSPRYEGEEQARLAEVAAAFTGRDARVP